MQISGPIAAFNLRREFVTAGELMSRLRARGIEEVSVVKLACMEGNGEISVILFGQDSRDPRRVKRSTV